MEVQVRNNIALYLTDSFIESLDNFELLLHNSDKQVSHCNFTNVYLGSNSVLISKTLSQLTPAFNKQTVVQLIVLRVLWNQFYTFLLTAQKLPVTQSSQLCCVIIQTASLQAPYFEGWKKQLGLLSLINVKEPYLETDRESDLQIIRAVIQNTQIKQAAKWKCEVNEIKKIGNELYNKGDYVNAFYCYEYCLTFCHNYLDSRTRAILYANSAASLYKLNLFDSSLVYSNITSRIDRDYYKAYVWKVQCLLQKKAFGEIPNLLVILQPKASPSDFSKINSKYSVYLSNSLGMYNWKQISQIGKNEVTISDYFNKHIGLRIQEDRPFYYALEGFKKQTTIIISKPLIYHKKGDLMKPVLSQRVAKCAFLQKSFYKFIKDIAGLSNYGWEQRKQQAKLDLKELQRSISKYFMKPRDICCDESEAVGIWPQFYKFAHNCNPNCSIVHLDSIMIVSTNTNIAKGETLTLDLAMSSPPTKRKEFLLAKYNNYCKCTICEWKSWPDFSNKDEVAKVADTLTNITMIKQVFWELLSKKYENYQEQLIIKSTKLVIKEISWQDMIIAMRLLRENVQKTNKILMDILASGFQTFFKIPLQLALEIIENLK